jgi:hypothetical protein
MRGTIPILTCDHEDGCDAWVIDNYELGVTNWRECMRLWVYDPHTDRESALCPEHKTEGDPR